MNGNRQMNWVCGQNSTAPSLEGSAILSLFADARSDVLVLLDTCAAASAVTRSQFGVMEVIAACGFEGRAAPAGEHSFTNTLVEILEDWINVPVFSASFLHAEIIRQLKQKEQKRGREGIRLEWCSTPIHIWCAKNSKSPGIEICCRREPAGGFSSGQCLPGFDPTSMSFDASDNSLSPLSSVDKEGKYNTPHVQISLRLTIDQPLNSNSANRCAKWLKSIPLLTKWAIMEAVYPSFSTLLTLSVPVPVWNLLPDSLAWSSVGYITGPSYGLAVLHCIQPSPKITVPTPKTCDASTQCDLENLSNTAPLKEEVQSFESKELDFLPRLTPKKEGSTLKTAATSERLTTRAHVLKSAPTLSFNGVSLSSEIAKPSKKGEQSVINDPNLYTPDSDDDSEPEQSRIESESEDEIKPTYLPSTIVERLMTTTPFKWVLRRTL